MLSDACLYAEHKQQPPVKCLTKVQCYFNSKITLHIKYLTQPLASTWFFHIVGSYVCLCVRLPCGHELL